MDHVEDPHRAALLTYRDAVDQLTDVILERVADEVVRVHPAANAIDVESQLLDDGRWALDLVGVRSGDRILATADRALEWELLRSQVDPLLHELPEVNAEACRDFYCLILSGR